LLVSPPPSGKEIILKNSLLTVDLLNRLSPGNGKCVRTCRRVLKI
jgi:hypothetical protein